MSFISCLLTVINLQVQEHIFVESNKLIRSIQVLLNTLNELRLYHVMEQSLVSLRKDNSKVSYTVLD